MSKKKVIIIGAGISGLSCGIYCLDNDFDVEIYEKHTMPGGECTGWYRDGVYIDGCAHWIVGTNPNSDFYPLWYHIGAINEETKIHEAEYFVQFARNNELYTIYADLDKLYDEILRISPEDKKFAKELIKRIEDYQHVRVPMSKPLDLMNPIEFAKFGLNMLPMLYSYLYSRKESMEDFASKAKSPLLKEMFSEVMKPNTYNSHSFFYTMHALSKEDAGVCEGGSLKIALRVADKYEKEGGKLFLNTPVKNVVIENNVAKGIVLENGEKKYADYVVSSCDINFTFEKLIGNQYRTKHFKEMFKKKKDYPLNSCIYLSFEIPFVGENVPKTLNVKIDPIKLGNDYVESLVLRSHAFDLTLNKDRSTITSMVYCNYDLYDYLKNLPKEEYLKFKEEFGENVRKQIVEHTSLKDDEIKLIDVATPLTYERYTNAYKGSYMSFITTKRSKWLLQKNILKGLKNFVLAGQWLMPPGGLPIAILTGKHAAYRICHLDHKKFINKEEKKAKFYLKKMSKR